MAPGPGNDPDWPGRVARPPVWDPAHYGYGPVLPGGGAPTPEPPTPAPPRRWWPIVAIAAAAALVASLAAVGAVVLLDDPETSTVENVFRLPEPGSNTTLGGEALDIQGVLAVVQPSVVTLDVGGGSEGFGVFEGAGTGLVITADGTILTNAHVVDRATEIQVTFFDGTTATASVVGSFPDDDIAIIQAANVDGLVPATLGSSEALRVGDDVVAIGNALGLGGTPSVTSGIVSALERSIDAETVQLENLIQTDAAINPGNSGGPLVNAAGEVVGINTAIIDDAQNVGFAIAIDVVKPLIERAQDGDAEFRPETAYLGISSISVPSVAAGVREEFGVVVADGAFVQDVGAGSPAESAGVVRGDVVLSIDGEPVDSATDIARAIRERNPGDEVALVIDRAGEQLTITVVLDVRGN